MFSKRQKRKQEIKCVIKIPCTICFKINTRAFSFFSLQIILNEVKATSWVHYTTSCVTHSLVLLKMAEINARNMLS